MDGLQPSSNRVENGTIDDLVLAPPAEQSKTLSDFRSLQGRIGILGGTFDPIQNGHLALAKSAIEAHGLDAVVFIPASHNPLKGHMPVASDSERMFMILEAIKEEPKLFVSSVELERSGNSFTIDTLRQAHSEIQAGSEIFLIMGSDNLPQLPKWRDIDQILTLAKIIVHARPGSSLDNLEQLSSRFGAKCLDEIRKLALVGQEISASSSAIRESLEKGLIPEGDLPELVKEFIIRSRIYFREAN